MESKGVISDAKTLFDRVAAAPKIHRDIARERSVFDWILNRYESGQNDAEIASPCPFYILAALEQAGFKIENKAGVCKSYHISWERK